MHRLESYRPKRRQRPHRTRGARRRSGPRRCNGGAALGRRAGRSIRVGTGRHSCRQLQSPRRETQIRYTADADDDIRLQRALHQGVQAAVGRPARQHHRLRYRQTSPAAGTSEDQVWGERDARVRRHAARSCQLQAYQLAHSTKPEGGQEGGRGVLTAASVYARRNAGQNRKSHAAERTPERRAPGNDCVQNSEEGQRRG
mmetsp:Transcript_25863/g.62296  ORF Transcript_25863/g.62296 Transcript_25863/m.62296 type:complete len:200 (-) Transcript_25863:990-1589(-)